MALSASRGYQNQFLFFNAGLYTQTHSLTLLIKQEHFSSPHTNPFWEKNLLVILETICFVAGGGTEVRGGASAPGGRGAA
jgi:hypothetical protein